MVRGGGIMSETMRILMERDGLTAEEAREQMNETREAIIDGDFEAMADYLGLENDYIFDLF